MELLNTQNLVKRFDDALILDHLNIHVPQGIVHGLLGPNGAGKTTLIRIINRILKEDEGNIFYRGKPLSSAKTENIGYLPEERGLYRKMKVGEQILYLARLKGMNKSQALQSAQYWMHKFEMESWWKKRIEELSKGMQQKIQFLVTIIHDPDFIIFDEPFSGFDPINANMLKQEVNQLKNQGKTIILSTHNMNSVEELCDHITLLDKGQIHVQGSISQIKEKHKSHLQQISFRGTFEDVKADLESAGAITSHSHQGDIHTIYLRYNNKQEANNLLASLVKKVQLISYKELYPTMNDIFLQAVKEKANEP